VVVRLGVGDVGLQRRDRHKPLGNGASGAARSVAACALLDLDAQFWVGVGELA
jgi:hypothetical protein